MRRENRTVHYPDFVVAGEKRKKLECGGVRGPEGERKGSLETSQSQGKDAQLDRGATWLDHGEVREASSV